MRNTLPIFPDVLSASDYAKRNGWEVYIIERIPQGFTVTYKGQKWSEEDDDRK